MTTETEALTVAAEILDELATLVDTRPTDAELMAHARTSADRVQAEAPAAKPLLDTIVLAALTTPGPTVDRLREAAAVLREQADR